LVSRYRQTRSQYHQDYYSDLLYSKNFIDLYTEIINKDIERTKGTNEEKQIMRNILKAYARRNSKVGYVQGHNFIIRLVLELITDEEEAFWTYCYIVEECFSVSYFMNLKSLMLDSLIFRILLKAVEPKLAVHLQKIYDFDLDLVTFKWFLSLYTDSSLPRDYIHKIYDLLVLGDKLVYLKAGFVILSEIGSKLLKCKEISDVYQVIDSMNQHIKISADKFIEKVNKIYINERILEIIKISNQHKIQKANQLMKEQPGYKEPRKGRGIPPPQCRTGILICTEREQPKGSELDSFTFSCKNIIKNKINDYFSDHHGFWEENKRRHRVKQRETDILLHRTKHVCAKTQMHANFRYLEAELLTTDYSLQDLKKDIRTTFPIIYDEIRKAEQLEHDHYEGMEAKSFEEEETKTLPRASSRMYKLNTTSWSQMKKGYAADI
jgi:Rab-GTPase-TBC domain